MGSNNGKQHARGDNHKRRPTIRRILQISSRQRSSTSRPVSYAGINQYYEDYHQSNRPMSMIDVAPFDSFEISKKKLTNYFS